MKRFPGLSGLFSNNIARKQRLRECLEQARAELEFARQHSDLCCDVCGPHGHRFFACSSAATKAVAGFLAFHHFDAKEIHNLPRLVTLAAGYAKDFDECKEWATSLSAYGALDREAKDGELEEALRLAEQIIGIVESALSPTSPSYR